MEIDRNAAEQKVRAPAIGVIATGGLGALLQIGSILMTLTGSVPQFEGSSEELPDWYGAFAGTWGVVSGVVGIAVAVFLIWGALKMMRLESWGIALTTCILALVPCVSPCCLLGLPFGIWGLVVLNDQAVKQAFRG